VENHSFSRDSKLLEACKEVYLQANIEKTKYMVISRHQNSGQNHNLLTASKSSENVKKLKYLGKISTIKIAFKKKLRADEIQGMSANIQIRIVGFPVSSLKILRLKLF
jgi:hypothetical protein